MTPDQINAKVAEILLAEGETWAYRLIYQESYDGDLHSPQKRPLPFTSDPAAAWRLFIWANANLDWRNHEELYVDLANSFNTGKIYRLESPRYRKKTPGIVLAEAFIAAKEKK